MPSARFRRRGNYGGQGAPGFGEIEIAPLEPEPVDTGGGSAAIPDPRLSFL